MMRTTKDPELKEYFEEKLRRAVFIMNCVEKRRETLVNICRAILRLQEDHFLNGTPIAPMLMREVAEEAGINGSTVSRAVQGKYIMYRKTELLRDFFSGKAIEGSEVSGREIRNILADMIRKEDRENPLSDMQIVEEMEKQGISISRRTVNKYRKLMGIPDSRHRI
jgi:RNA polymerase sigma-54 factor